MESPELAHRARIVGRLAAAFPSAGVTEGTIDVYVRELADVPVSMFERAARQLMDSAKFFPTIAEIREIVDTMVSSQPKAPAYNCQFCFGSGWEIYLLDGYKTARRCFH